MLCLRGGNISSLLKIGGWMLYSQELIKCTPRCKKSTVFVNVGSEKSTDEEGPVKDLSGSKATVNMGVCR